MKDLLRVVDLAPLLGVSPTRVYQLIEAGDLPSCRVGNAIVVPRPAYEKWLATLTNEAETGISRKTLEAQATA